MIKGYNFDRAITTSEANAFLYNKLGFSKNSILEIGSVAGVEYEIDYDKEIFLIKKLNAQIKGRNVFLKGNFLLDFSENLSSIRYLFLYIDLEKENLVLNLTDEGVYETVFNQSYFKIIDPAIDDVPADFNNYLFIAAYAGSWFHSVNYSFMGEEKWAGIKMIPYEYAVFRDGINLGNQDIEKAKERSSTISSDSDIFLTSSDANRNYYLDSPCTHILARRVVEENGTMYKSISSSLFPSNILKSESSFKYKIIDKKVMYFSARVTPNSDVNPGTNFSLIPAGKFPVIVSGNSRSLEAVQGFKTKWFSELSSTTSNRILRAGQLEWDPDYRQIEFLLLRNEPKYNYSDFQTFYFSGAFLIDGTVTSM